jgi:hypothetical protein
MGTNRQTSSIIGLQDANAPKKSIWTTTVIVSTVLMLTSGTMNTIGFAIQGDKYGYKHGVCQTALMFIGEYLNLFILNTRLVSSYSSFFNLT